MWYNKGSIMLYPKGKKSRRVCLRVVQGGKNKMRNKKNEVITLVLGGIIGGTAALGQGQENVSVHIVIILVCVVAAIIHILRMKEN